MSNAQIQPRKPRVPFVRPVHVSLEDGSDSRWLLASNISSGGLFVRTPEPPAVGTKLRLDLEARGQTLRFAEAEVVWSRPVDMTRLSQALPGFGVRFLPLSEESLSLVQHLVDVGGTARGQAKTVPFSHPDSLARKSREPLHAPAAAMVEALVPTERAVTAEWAAIPPLGEGREPKIVVNMSDPPIALGDDEPSLDRASIAAHPAELKGSKPSRSASRGGDWIAGLILIAAAGIGGLCAWRGLSDPVQLPEPPPTVITAQPAPKAEVASPEGPDGITAAKVEAAAPAPTPEPIAKPEPVATPEPTKAAPAPVVAAPEPSAIALPSGAAKSVSIVEQGGAIQVAAQLAAGASIARFFTLSSPPRVVLDLDGASPKGAPRVKGRDGITAVRLGARAGGTRMVFDLSSEPKKVTRTADGVAIELR